MASGIVEQSSQDSQTPQGPGQSRSKLVQRLLGASSNLPAFVNDLLGTMAVVVAGTEAAGFLIERTAAPMQMEVAAEPEEGEEADGEGVVGEAPEAPGTPPGQPGFGLRPIAHIRPDESDAETRAAALKAFQEILAPCIAQNKDGAIEVGSPDAGEPQFCLVTLLRSEGQVVAAAAVITRCRDTERARQRLMSMQLVAGYFELWTMRRAAEQAKQLARTQQDVLQLAGAVGTAEGFESAAMNLCNELANRTGATRVSLGWMKGKYIRVKALSHTEKFDKKQDLIIQIEKAMEECVDQDDVIRYDTDGQRSDNVTRSAEQLSRMQGGNSVFSVPLRGKDEVLGVVTLEFAPPYKLTPQAADAIVVAADVLTPALRDRQENDRWIAVKVGKSIENAAKVTVGPRHMLVKLVIVLVIGAAFFITLFKPMYHVSAPFTLGAIGKEVVSAPFDGFIDKVFFKPGDMVHKGDRLISMKTEDLILKRHKAESDAATARANYTLNINSKDKDKQSQAMVSLREADAADADRMMLDAQIAQASLLAPFDGIVLKGDLEDKQGAAVKLGDVLLEVAPLHPPDGENAIRAELQVPERDIQELRDPKDITNLFKRQMGTIATTSYPNDNYRIRIDRIVPMGEPKEGENTFKVYAHIENPAAWMRPGMQGEAKIDTEHRRLVWIWTHRLVDFLRLKLWM